MITKEDFHYNFRHISLGCKLGVLPLTVSLEKGELRLLHSGKKRALCMARFMLFTFHAIFIVLRLPYLQLQGISVSLLSLMLHLTYLLAIPAVVFWHMTAFFVWPGITVECFNKALDTWGCMHPGSPFKGLRDRPCVGFSDFIPLF